ncbi:MAG: leucine-rich repeat protein [Clostridia bacterium]|nr:leucine-rich repeat protein [Clostridia bacterium]
MKKISLLLLILLTIIASFALVACDEAGTSDNNNPSNDVPTEVKYKISFVVDGVTVSSVMTSGNEIIELPSTPQKEGYTFVKWMTNDGKTILENTYLNSALKANVVANAIFEKAPKKELSPTEIYEKVNPSVVFILANGEDLQSSGSGFFIDTNGTIVTNYHVIDKMKSAEILLSNKTEAKIENVIGYDKGRDIAILSTTATNTQPIIFGDSDAVKVGESVYAIGYPQAFSLGVASSTFTTGIVSTLRNFKGYNYIQSTVEITHGNSGGVLINTFGEVIGITTSGLTIDDVDYMNLSIPINELADIDRNGTDNLLLFYNKNKPWFITYYVNGKLYYIQEYEYMQTTSFVEYDKNDHGYKSAWYRDSSLKNKFTFGSPITDNITLYHKAEKATYTISYQLNGGSVGYSASRSYTIDNAQDALTIPSKSGCIFEGWKDNSGNFITNLPDVTQLRDLTLTACWIEGISGYFTTSGSSITKYSGSNSSICIPPRINGVIINSIGDNAFKNLTTLREVIIPSTVTSIGANSFSGCRNLGYITLPRSISSINSSAFYNCSYLDKVYIEDLSRWYAMNFNNSSANPLYYAKGLYLKDSTTPITSITIPEGITSIKPYVFCGYKALSSVSIPNSVTTIGKDAFLNCTSLKYNKYDNGYYLGNNDNPYLFLVKANGTSIESCVINNNTRLINISAFSGCSSLKSVTIPNGVTSIGANAFYNCTSLTSVTIPNRVTSIGDNAFYNCHRLFEVYNFSSLSITKGSSYAGYVGYYALDIYTSATATSKLHTTSDGYIFYEDGDTVYLLGYIGTSTTLTLPDNYNGNNYAIYKSAFYQDINITSITIGSGVTSIGYSAFSGCTSLTEIKFNATSMNDLSKDNQVFYNAGQSGSGIKVTIGKNVTKIPAYLFYPDTDNNSSTPKITRLEFEEGSACKSIRNYAFYYCSSLTSITIPSSVTSIGSYAFYNCTSLTSITIPSGVTSIGSYAFYNCTSLTEINFNATAMNDLSYYNDVFSYAGQSGSGIKVTIGKNVTKIPAYLFHPYSSSYAPKITSVEFEEGSVCTSIGRNAFYNCTSLTSITIPNSVTSIGDFAFYNCSSLTSISIPNSVTSIYNYAFRGCTSLTSVIIGSGVTSIYNYAFCRCTSLTSVTIGSGVTSIGSYAFDYCYKLVEVYNLSSLDITKGSTSYGRTGYYALDIYTSATATSKLHTTSDGYIFYEDGDTVYLLGYTGNSATLILPDKYNGKNYAIYKYAFYENYKITNVTIPNSVTSIGSYAFDDCTSLSSVTFINPDGWWYSSSSSATSGTSISSTNLENTSTAATYLKSTYTNYYWKKS